MRRDERLFFAFLEMFFSNGGERPLVCHGCGGGESSIQCRKSSRYFSVCLEVSFQKYFIFSVKTFFELVFFHFFWKYFWKCFHWKLSNTFICYVLKSFQGKYIFLVCLQPSVLLEGKRMRWMLNRCAASACRYYLALCLQVFWRKTLIWDLKILKISNAFLFKIINFGSVEQKEQFFVAVIRNIMSLSIYLSRENSVSVNLIMLLIQHCCGVYKIH